MWKISFNHVHALDAYAFSLMATKILRKLRPTEAWNRTALWVPFCTPFITMTWTDSWLYREMLPLPWIQFRSLTVIKLMTLLSLQTRLKVCNSNWTNYMTIHVQRAQAEKWATCNPASWSPLVFLFRGGGALRYSVPTWLLFLSWCGECLSLPA